MSIPRRRLEYATLAFMAEMRRQWVVENPDTPCPIKPLEEYPEGQRSALMLSIGRAITSASKEADITFATWLARQNQ